MQLSCMYSMIMLEHESVCNDVSNYINHEDSNYINISELLEFYQNWTCTHFDQHIGGARSLFSSGSAYIIINHPDSQRDRIDLFEPENGAIEEPQQISSSTDILTHENNEILSEDMPDGNEKGTYKYYQV